MRDDTYKHKGFEWQVRKSLEDHDDLKNFTYTDTALPCTAKKNSNVRRADFVYVLKDRVVILEVDENEHRYNIPECERKREQQLADSVTAGMYVVVIRYNPMAKWIARFFPQGDSREVGPIGPRRARAGGNAVAGGGGGGGGG
jgi:hypothetical protein